MKWRNGLEADCAWQVNKVPPNQKLAILLDRIDIGLKPLKPRKYQDLFVPKARKVNNCMSQHTHTPTRSQNKTSHRRSTEAAPIGVLEIYELHRWKGRTVEHRGHLGQDGVKWYILFAM